MGGETIENTVGIYLSVFSQWLPLNGPDEVATCFIFLHGRVYWGREQKFLPLRLEVHQTPLLLYLKEKFSYTTSAPWSSPQSTAFAFCR